MRYKFTKCGAFCPVVAHKMRELAKLHFIFQCINETIYILHQLTAVNVGFSLMIRF